MDDKELLDAIGRVAREEDGDREFDERWRRLSAGTLSPEEDAELRALAEESEEARLDYAAFRPLDEDFTARVVRRIRQANPPASGAGGVGGAGGEVPGTSGRRARTRRRTRRGWLRSGPGGWVAAAATVAAVAAVVLLRPAPPPLVEYDFEVRGGHAGTRAGDAPSFFAPGSTVEITLVPAEPVEEPLERRFYLQKGCGDLMPFQVDEDREVSKEGTVVIDREVGRELPLDVGRRSLVYVFGRPGRMPDLEDLAAGKRPRGDWTVLRVPLTGEDGCRLEVEYTGCYGLSEGPTCVPKGDELTLWVRADRGAEVEVRAGDLLVEEEGVAVAGGRRLTVEVPEAGREIHVRALGPAVEHGWRLRIADFDGPPWLHEAHRLKDEGRVDEARRLLEEGLESADAGHRAVAHSLLARFGSPSEEEARRHLEQSIPVHAETGQLIQLVEDVALLAHWDIRDHRFSEARRRLEALHLPAGAPADAKFHLAYNLGRLEREVGNYRAALAAFDRALAVAEKVASAKRAMAEEAKALALQSLGQVEEAHRLMSGAGSGQAAATSCERARWLNNQAWLSILSPSGAKGDPLALLDEAAVITGPAACGESLRLNLALNRALAFADSGRRSEAFEALAHVEERGEAMQSLHRLWYVETRARLALDGGSPLDALAYYREIEGEAEALLLPEARWRSRVGQARAHRALGDASAALAALRAAESLLDEQLLQVPLGAGPAGFAALREEGAGLHLEVLLAEGRRAEALAVARRSRSRALRSLFRGYRLENLGAEDRARWESALAAYYTIRSEIEARLAEERTLAAESRAAMRAVVAERVLDARAAIDRAVAVFPAELRAAPADPPPLRDGETLLVYHPAEGGWAGFAATAGGIAVHRFEMPPDLGARDLDELSEVLLEPFREAIDGARRLRILPYGPLSPLDFHALPWKGDVLLAAVPVVYGADLGGSAAAPGPLRTALVVADPHGDLPAAGREGAVVAEALAGMVEVTAVGLTDAAGLRSKLERAPDLFHYAGHGVVRGEEEATAVASGAQGASGEAESALKLAGNSRFTLGDVLALSRAPRRVVLSACETSLGSSPAVDASLGLAQAFLVSGSRSVVAAVRPVGDEAAERLFRRYYEDWDPAEDEATRLRNAQLAWRELDPRGEWSSFRVFEP